MGGTEKVRWLVKHFGKTKNCPLRVRAISQSKRQNIQSSTNFSHRLRLDCFFFEGDRLWWRLNRHNMQYGYWELRQWHAPPSLGSFNVARFHLPLTNTTSQAQTTQQQHTSIFWNMRAEPP